jgi:hypothetical protein
MTDQALVDRLAQRLWDEGHVVTVLLYRLTVTRLLLGDDGAAGIGVDLLRAVEELTSATRRTEDLLVDLRRELSELEDLGIAQGIGEPQVQQVAYEATLQALGRALPPSLVAFLR